MRTTLEIEDSLMDDALRASGEKTENDAVIAGLRLLVNIARQAKVRELWGSAQWEGNLEESRLSRFADQEW